MNVKTINMLGGPVVILEILVEQDSRMGHSNQRTTVIAIGKTLAECKRGVLEAETGQPIGDLESEWREYMSHWRLSRKVEMSQVKGGILFRRGG